MAHEHIEQAVLGLGRGIAEDAVVVGSGAIGLALPEFRDRNDTDLAVSEDAFNYLRSQPGWQETPGRDGTTRLVKDSLDVGTGWGGTTDYNGLKARSWRTASGLRVAGLPDVYAYKQSRASSADVEDMRNIRCRLQDPGRSPFPSLLIPHEIAAARACLPEELQDDPDAQAAILLAANGLHTVYTLYGHPQIGQTNQIIGDLERPEFQVPATYHNGFGLVRDARLLQRHLGNVGAPARDRLLTLATDPYTDAIYGNGRFSDNPEGHDERRSADLLKGHALQLGFSSEEAHRMHAAALDTTFDEAAGKQRGKDSADSLARSVVAVDLQPLAEPDSLERMFDLAVEDGFSARYSAARTIGRVLCERGEPVDSTADALRLIDRYAQEKPAGAPDGPTVMQAFATRLARNASFQRAHQYPHDWTLDNPVLRQDHAAKLEDVSAKLLAGKPAVEAYDEDVQEHTAAMTARYGTKG